MAFAPRIGFRYLTPVTFSFLGASLSAATLMDGFHWNSVDVCALKCALEPAENRGCG